MTAAGRRHERGSYRSILTVLLDGKDFRALPHEPRWTFVALKLTLGPCQIGVFDALDHSMAAKTGYRIGAVRAALDRLRADDWVRTEGNVVWVVEGLRYEPSYNPRDDKHRKAVRAFVSTLPNLPIVDAFRRHYADYYIDGAPEGPPENGEGPSKGAVSKEDRRPKTEDGRPKTEDGRPKTDITGALESGGSVVTAAGADDADFCAAWERYPARAGGNSRKDAYRAWCARLRDGVRPADIVAGVDRYAAFIRATGKERTEYVKQAATFFGPGEHWLEVWAVPAPSARDLTIGERAYQKGLAALGATP